MDRSLAERESAALDSIESCDDTALSAGIEKLWLVLKRDDCEYRSYHWAQDPLRVVRACLRACAHYAATSDICSDARLDPLLGCLESGVQFDRNNESPAIAPILDHADALPFLLRAFSFTRGPVHQSLTYTMRRIILKATDGERVTIIVRYYEPLRQAMANFELLFASEIFGLPEFSAIMINVPMLMNKLYEHLQGSRRHADVSNVAANLMDIALSDSAQLEELLGLGLLSAVRDFTADDGGFWPYHEGLYTTVLERHPEWAQSFKEYTAGGDPTMALAAMGARIRRAQTTPAQYVLQVKEQQMEPLATVHAAPVPTQPTTVVVQKEMEEEEGEGAAPEFTDLPLHFLIKLARTMTFNDLTCFRLSCGKALQAVDHVGRSERALDVTRLVCKYWPDKGAALTFDSLYGVQNEMVRLSHWLNLDAVTSIDYDGLRTMSSMQLERVFGIKPRLNVCTLNLVGLVVMPTVWTTLARLFPGVTNVRCTETSCQFPAEINREVSMAHGETVGECTIIDKQNLSLAGLLSEERLVTLRCLKTLFSGLRYIYVE